MPERRNGVQSLLNATDFLHILVSSFLPDGFSLSTDDVHKVSMNVNSRQPSAETFSMWTQGGEADDPFSPPWVHWQCMLTCIRRGVTILGRVAAFRQWVAY